MQQTKIDQMDHINKQLNETIDKIKKDRLRDGKFINELIK